MQGAEYKMAAKFSWETLFQGSRPRAQHMMITPTVQNSFFFCKHLFMFTPAVAAMFLLYNSPLPGFAVALLRVANRAVTEDSLIKGQ